MAWLIWTYVCYWHLEGIETTYACLITYFIDLLHVYLVNLAVFSAVFQTVLGASLADG